MTEVPLEGCRGQLIPIDKRAISYRHRGVPTYWSSRRGAGFLAPPYVAEVSSKASCLSHRRMSPELAGGASFPWDCDLGQSGDSGTGACLRSPLQVWGRAGTAGYPRKDVAGRNSQAGALGLWFQ